MPQRPPDWYDPITGAPRWNGLQHATHVRARVAAGIAQGRGLGAISQEVGLSVRPRAPPPRPARAPPRAPPAPRPPAPPPRAARPPATPPVPTHFAPPSVVAVGFFLACTPAPVLVLAIARVLVPPPVAISLVFIHIVVVISHTGVATLRWRRVARRRQTICRGSMLISRGGVPRFAVREIA
jgi:hypothetical protein